MALINADELAKSYKLTTLKKIPAKDINDTDLMEISIEKENPKYYKTSAIEVGEYAKRIADYISKDEHDARIVDGIAIIDKGKIFRENPLKALSINITAVQEGSGDPSPENERPIRGWTGANILHGEESFYKTDGTIGVGITSDVKIISSDSIRVYRNGSTNYPSSKQLLSNYDLTLGKTYAVIADADITIGTAMIATRDSNNTIVSTSPRITTNSCLSYVFTYSANMNYLSFFAGFDQSVGDIIYKNIKFFEVNTISITWEDEAGTVWGGYIKPLTGELTATHLIADLGDFNWSHSSMFYANSPSNTFASTSGDLTGKLMCSCYKVISGNIPPHSNKIITMNNKTTGLSKVIRIYDTDYNDTTTFKAAVTGQKIVYELATPITYQLTPAEIMALVGQNNIFADCGDVTECKYTMI